MLTGALHSDCHVQQGALLLVVRSMDAVAIPNVDSESAEIRMFVDSTQ
jgi:hypothetical protein